jgi:hypothetical protein
MWEMHDLPLECTGGEACEGGNECIRLSVSPATDLTATFRAFEWSQVCEMPEDCDCELVDGACELPNLVGEFAGDPALSTNVDFALPDDDDLVAVSFE